MKRETLLSNLENAISLLVQYQETNNITDIQICESLLRVTYIILKEEKK